MKIIKAPGASEPATDAAIKPQAGADGGESLEALGAEAVALDGAPTAASQAQEVRAQEQAAEVLQSNEAELFAALDLARAMALPILPADKAEKLRTIWSDERLKVAAAAGAAVLGKHGLSMGGILGDYGPYIALLAALAPPVLETRAVLMLPAPKPAEGEGG